MVAINTMYCEKRLPVFTSKLPDYENYNKQMLELIKQYREKFPEKEEHTNLRAWRSQYDAHIKESRFEHLIDKCCEFATTVSKHIWDSDLVYLPSAMWVGQYDKGNYARKHHHAPNDFACVYYIDVDENSSPIIFEDELVLPPESGMIAMFPGDLNHRVEPTDSPRTIAAMNLVKKLDIVEIEYTPEKDVISKK